MASHRNSPNFKPQERAMTIPLSEIVTMSDFMPIEYLGAYYFEIDYTECYGEIVHDFLK